MAEAAECDKVKAWMMKQVEDSVNKQSRPGADDQEDQAILPQDLSIEGGELTPTMKVKRKIVNKKYADLIEAFYPES
jgi:long-chain acyl-CoA synthetase